MAALQWRSPRCSRAAVLAKPPGPSSPHRRRKDQLIEQLRQPIRIHIEADVVDGPFTENLLVDTDAIGTVVEVVGDRRAAPPNVQRQLHASARPRKPGVVEVGRHRYGARGGSELSCTGTRHLEECTEGFSASAPVYSLGE